MIVISGALVLVALVLLVIGIVGPELGFVYASIGVSLVSLVFLVIGILQRRGETLPAPAGAPAPAPRVDTSADTATAVIPSQARAAAEPAPIAASADEELETGGTVLVVAGRPRYHVAGCRYLGGKDAEAIDVLDAREEGFTPCGVCKPDDALAALEAEEAAQLEEQPAEEPVEEPALEEVEASTPTRVRATSRKTPAVLEVPADKPARAARASKAVPVAAVSATKATKAPARTPAKKAPAKVVAPVEVAPVKAARKAPAKAPSKAATLAADSTPAAASAKRTGTVVVIPDRGRFHRAECRYVRGVDGAEDLTRAAATRQGYEACGVCKP